MRVTYYGEVLSSWCHWAEPTWAALRNQFAGRAEFVWKPALMPAAAFPISRDQCDWFYRRSGTIVRSPYRLNSGWFDPGESDYAIPNLLAAAARESVADLDPVRLALTHAALREGRKIARWEIGTPIAAAAAGLEPGALQTRAASPALRARVDATTAEFHALGVDQRPAFLLESEIGDRAIFSGLIAFEPLAATLTAMLADVAGYASHRAHEGEMPRA